jgi:hypothetical protein
MRLPAARRRLGLKKKRPTAAGEHHGQKEMRLPAARQHLRSKKQHLRSKKRRLPAARQLAYRENGGLRSTEESRITTAARRTVIKA